MHEMHNIVIGRDEADESTFGERGTGIIGRHYVGEKKEAHLTNAVRMDFARPHIVGIFGKRGTGKSYTIGVIAEEMALLKDDVRKNLSCVIVDAMGIYWSMKNINDRDVAAFAEWNIKPTRFSTRVIIPYGQVRKFLDRGIPFDAAFFINTKDLAAEDWAITLNVALDSEMGVLLQKALKRMKKFREYSLEDIAMQIKEDKSVDQHIRDALINRFAVASDWGVFERGTEHENISASSQDTKAAVKPGDARIDRIALSSVQDIAIPGKVSVIDLSMLEDNSVRSLIIGLLVKKVLEARITARRIEELESISGEYSVPKTPMTWIMIDEAQQFLPAKGNTPATLPLLQCIKIGREPGVSMVFATQQPNKLHEAAISQCDLVIAHRLTAKQDIDSLKDIMQTYIKYDLQEYLDALPRVKGAAIVLDDNSERIYAIRVRMRMSWHAGGSPSAVKELK